MTNLSILLSINFDNPSFIHYFPDTDTAHVKFKDNYVHETKEISENIYIDIDAKGNLMQDRDVRAQRK